jgi:hypothetical protein
MKTRTWTFPALMLLLTASSLFADFRYEETSKITGGAVVSMMKFAGAFSRDAKQAMQPVTSTVLVKGNRMARINPDTTEIIDLDKETITRIDHRNKQYTVVTFEQMKQQIQEAQQRAQREAKQHPAEQTTPSEPPPQLTFKATVKNTGASKNVAGLDASEAILSMTLEGTDQKTGQTGAMAITNDMWMVPEIPGYQEVRDFNRRLAMKMGMVLGDAFKPALGAMQPGSAEGMAEMVKEMSKLKGVPVQQIMRMGATPNGEPLPAASEAPLPQQQGPQMPSAGEVAQKSATSAITSKLGGFGGFGGFGRRHKGAEQEPPAQDQPGTAAAQSVLLEATTEMTSFSAESLDASRFNVPEGYAQVAPPNRIR